MTGCCRNALELPCVRRPERVDRTRQALLWRHHSPTAPARVATSRSDRNNALERLQRALNPTESVRTRRSLSLQARIGDS